jgi:hypothetical protein
MAVFNYANREITAKIVYYGPGLCGKTTNLEVIHKKIAPQNRGQMLSLATETDRTLFFDLLPVDIGTVGGFAVKLQLFTVPGQPYYNKTRMMVLRGADGVVFVADSQEKQLQADAESMKNLEDNLSANNLDPNTIPLIIQFNKQDLFPLASTEDLNRAVNRRNVPTVKAVAVKGDGVLETLKLITREVMTSMQSRIGKGVEPAPKPAEPPQKRPAEPIRVASGKLEAIHEAKSLGEGSDPVEILEVVKLRLAKMTEMNRTLAAQCVELSRTMDALSARIKKGGK